MNVAIISDTHIPSRAQRIPEWAQSNLRRADHVIHAGDFDSSKAVADVRALARRLTAVGGNMDPFGLDLPDVATVKLGGVEFVVTHGTGSPRGYEQRVASIVEEHASSDPAVGVAGHTHEVLDTTVDGVRLLNPGSVTAAPPADRETMLTAEVSEGDVDVELHTG
jgi:hypothetical protein